MDEKEWKNMKKTLVDAGVCDRCLGRQFHSNYPGKDNVSIGIGVRKESDSKKAEKEMKGKAFMPKDCPCCEGLFSHIKGTIEMCAELSANYEFETFLIGCKIPDKLLLQEEKVWGEVGIQYSESIKKDFNREVGIKLHQKNKKEIAFQHPDIMFICDLTQEKLKVKLQVSPCFVYGEYQKLGKIPQTKWFCRYCRGRGCKQCKGTGLKYDESVELFVAQPLLEMSGATGEKFHGAGREDKDVKMLGWRPFVVELQEPIKRELDYKKIEKQVNQISEGKVKVREMRLSSKKEVVGLKNTARDKTYEIIVECEKKVSQAKLKEIEEMFDGKVIKQRTPGRVSHRRADKVRERIVRSIKCEKQGDKKFKAATRCASGLYIKELVSGDEGRTNPCFADIVGPCTCVELNVLEVHA